MKISKCQIMEAIATHIPFDSIDKYNFKMSYCNKTEIAQDPANLTSMGTNNKRYLFIVSVIFDMRNVPARVLISLKNLSSSR